MALRVSSIWSLNSVDNLSHWILLTKKRGPSFFIRIGYNPNVMRFICALQNLRFAMLAAQQATYRLPQGSGASLACDL